MAPYGKPNATGRSSGKRTGNVLRFIQLFYWEMDCAAYRALSCYARALLLEIRKRYDRTNNGKISMAVREAAALLNCHKDTAAKALLELQEKGWICATQKGRFDWKTKMATTWRITNEPINLGLDTPATKEYASWKPDDEI